MAARLKAGGESGAGGGMAMSLKARLDEDLKAAMKAREAGRLRLSVLRMVKAAVRNAEIAQGRELDDPGVWEVLARELKQRQEALAEFERAGREERAAELREEMRILGEYLPAPLTAAELEEMARQAIAETGASGLRDMGKVMAVLMPRTRGRAEGRLVNETVRRLLGG